jgi:hypothetical protein
MRRFVTRAWIWHLMALTAVGLAAPAIAQETEATEEQTFCAVVTDQDQLLQGEQAAGQLGDVRLSDADCVYIFSAIDHPLYRETTGGALIDLCVKDGGTDRLGELRTAFGPRLTHFSRNTSISCSDEGRAVVVEGVDRENEAIRVRTIYRLDSPRHGLVATTELHNGTDEALEGWEIGDFVHWGSAAPFLLNLGVAFQTGFQASTECVIGFAHDFTLAVTPGHRREMSVIVHEAYTRLIDGKQDIAPGATMTVTRHLFVGLESMSTVAKAVWEVNDTPTGTLRGQVNDQATGDPIPGAEVLVNERGGRPRPLLRMVTDDKGEFVTALPAGMTVIGFPHSYTRTTPTQTVLPVELASGEEVAQQYLLSAPARVDLRVTDEDTGALIPARFALYDANGRPADLGPVQSGQVGGPYIFLASGEGVFEAPPGQFHLTISRGMEYSRYEQDVIFLANRTREFHVTLKRLVDTSGYVAADFGVLTDHSHGTLVSAPDRLRTAACAGLEFLVSADQGQVTDLAEAMREADLDLPLTVARGERLQAPESSPEGNRVGTWSVFPLPEEYAGRSAFAGEEFHSHRDLLRSVRRRFPQALICSLTPLRDGESPFLAMGYERDLVHHLYRSATPGSDQDLAFDLMEVFGDKDIETFRQNMELYYSLLREGHRITAVASANSHYAGLEEIGYPRTYVAADDADPRAISPDQVFASLKAGNALVTNGPWVEFSIMDRPMGSMIPWEQGEPIEVSLRVVCPVWMQLAYVDVCKEGLFVTRHTFLQPATGLVYDWTPEPNDRRFMVRHDQIFTVEVAGRLPITPMNPYNGFHIPFVPWAVTNPIWIDTDNNGRYDEPTPP